MGQDLPITSYALLGLLTFGDELTGYELKQRADMTLRFYWTAPAMSQVYSELARLTRFDLVRPSGEGRGTTYRITEEGQRALREWLDASPAGFPALKHPVALRLLLGHLGSPDDAQRLLKGYVDDLAGRRAELQAVRDSLHGRDEPGQAFRYPSLVADWGLAWYDSEERIARELIDRLASDG